MIGKRNGNHRQRDPAGPDSEQKALALAVRNGRFGEFLGVLLGVGSSSRAARRRLVISAASANALKTFVPKLNVSDDAPCHGTAAPFTPA